MNTPADTRCVYCDGHHRSSICPEQPGELVLGADAGGPRCFLHDVPIHAGTGIDLQLGNGRWLVGRIETSNGKPWFYFQLMNSETACRIPPGAIVRLPHQP